MTRSRIWGGAALAATVGMTVALNAPARAQNRERVLAGIRLNTNARNIIAKYGNPTQVVVGDTAVRLPRSGAGGGSAGGVGFGSAGGYPGGGGGFGGGYPGGGGAPTDSPGSMSGYPGGGGTNPFPVSGGYPGSGNISSPGVGLNLNPIDAPGGGGGYPGGGFGGGYPGGGGVFGGGGGAFGNTNSTLTRTQEVTWIYDRPGGVSYEFLIGAGGLVIQIRAIGYKGGNARTAKGIQLGSSYATVLQRYGYPEEHLNLGPILVASFKTQAHAQFQFLNNKIIAITIASVE